MNDITKGALFCLFLLVLIVVAGTCDYRDAVHFRGPAGKVGAVSVAKRDTMPTAYELIRYVERMEKE